MTILKYVLDCSGLYSCLLNTNLPACLFTSYMPPYYFLLPGDAATAGAKAALDDVLRVAAQAVAACGAEWGGAAGNIDSLGDGSSSGDAQANAAVEAAVAECLCAHFQVTMSPAVNGVPPYGRHGLLVAAEYWSCGWYRVSNSAENYGSENTQRIFCGAGVVMYICTYKHFPATSTPHLRCRRCPTSPV